MQRRHSLAFAPLLLAALAAPAMAQEAKPAAETAGGQVISYTPADFESSRPNTALDLINRLPGFTLIAGDQVRGFAGAAGNVLIDGQRPTIKTDTLSDTLNRIPIDQVERIDLIRGGAPGIDMQGQTVVANVIRKRADTFQQVVQLQGYMFADTGHTIPGWTYQATRRFGENQLDFSLNRSVSYDDSVGFGSRTTLDVPTGSSLFQKEDTEGDGAVHTGRISYKGPVAGGIFNANALISTDEFKNEEHFLSASTEERYIDRSANDRAEIGLNYKRPFGPQFELETLLLSKYAQGSGDSTGTTKTSSSIFGVDATAGETIGRSVLRYTQSPTLSLEGGGEVAYNFREQQVALTVDGAAIALPSSHVRVEELRGEGFAQATWRPAPVFTLEGGVRVERSTITESGDTPLERSFTYPKPRLVATWSPTKDDQVRLRIEREVGQLNFQDFASSVNLSSNVLSAGNAELQPDKRWVYEAAFEKRFPGGAAAVLTLRHQDISDVQDQFPFFVEVDANHDGKPDDSNGDGVPDKVLVSGPGNIGDGKSDGLEFNLTLPTKPFGLDGGEFKVSTVLVSSQVRDPLTGLERRISGERPRTLNASYRQDMPEFKLTWGLGWYGGWLERRYLLEEQDNLDLKNFYSSFIEWKPTPKFTLRAEIDNFDPYHFTITRYVFDGPRGSSAVSQIQTEERHSQVIGMLRARWAIG